MTPTEERVAERLRELATLAGPPGGPSTAERAAFHDRTRRRRALGRTVAAVAVVVVASTALLTRPESPAPSLVADTRTPAAVLAARTVPDAYELPPRGSLAGDEEFLAGVAALDWSETVINGQAWSTDPGSRRVVYAADVPGGHRWAVVLGRSGVQWMYAWFRGPAGADPDELELALPPERIVRGHVLALVDMSAPRGPLVVLGRPGDGAEYSPSLDRMPDGTLARQFAPLPVVDGVPLGTVTTPITWDAGQVLLVRDGHRIDLDLLRTGHPVSTLVYGTGMPDPAVLTPCMAALGIDVELDGSGGASWTDSSTGRLSSAEQAEREAAVEGCFAVATGGG
ncbi:hypothetical protein [Modestobacter versicolor]|uniref:Uncharacterized protein n=1 Tax=Modestobacter versicolor TaxID=429133 RepID=A0A323VIQ6_9ACTN|nr:hypothetical protein [Modestobacter versicolor]MBB3674917.1 hypothetical protein [Modestobacter versicolor]PZA19948.1 hypothetical protein DMO24_17985 [Modestobacter versicolor]